MSKSSKKTSQSVATSTRSHEFSRDDALEILSNQRRRFAIHYLKQNDDETTLSELTDRIASWENGKAVEELTPQERKRVRNALRQFHLPKMDDLGFIEYQQDDRTVRLTEAAASTNFYIDSLSGDSLPWGLYYLILSGLSAICLLGLWLNVVPFSLVDPLTCGLFFVTALVVSSVAHFYDNYFRMRLGARDEPPEVNDQ